MTKNISRFSICCFTMVQKGVLFVLVFLVLCLDVFFFLCRWCLKWDNTGFGVGLKIQFWSKGSLGPHWRATLTRNGPSDLNQRLSLVLKVNSGPRSKDHWSLRPLLPEFRISLTRWVLSALAYPPLTHPPPPGLDDPLTNEPFFLSFLMRFSFTFFYSCILTASMAAIPNTQKQKIYWSSAV